MPFTVKKTWKDAVLFRCKIIRVETVIATRSATIAVETVEAAHIQIGVRGIVGYLCHWVTAAGARMNFNSFG
jgi:hypothetical protein